MIETQWLVSMSHVPSSLVSDVSECVKQWAQWESWYGISVKSPDRLGYLRQHPGLVLDTSNFSRAFTQKLVKSYDDIDSLLVNGYLVRGDNSQALRVIEPSFRGKVDAVYIDPPYNTVHSEILYKNTFKHASWLSLLNNTLQLIPSFWRDPFAFGLAIDDFEQANLATLLDQLFPNLERSTIIVNHHPQGAGGRLSRTHQYMMVLSDPSAPQLKGRPRVDEFEDRVIHEKWLRRE